MPQLSSSRFKRPARGLVAVVVVGALCGPVGSAGAGVPAALPAANKIALGTSTVAKPAVVTDLLGTHAGAPLGPLSTAGKATRSAVAASDCSTRTQYGGGFNTKLGSTWTTLTARSYACTSAPAQGTYSSGVTFAVSKEAGGEFICRGSTYGYGSSVWFKTAKGFVWSGGTANPRWNGNC